MLIEIWGALSCQYLLVTIAKTQLLLVAYLLWKHPILEMETLNYTIKQYKPLIRLHPAVYFHFYRCLSIALSFNLDKENKDIRSREISSSFHRNQWRLRKMKSISREDWKTIVPAFFLLTGAKGEKPRKSSQPLKPSLSQTFFLKGWSPNNSTKWQSKTRIDHITSIKMPCKLQIDDVLLNYFLWTRLNSTLQLT